jgi:uncharacterized protein (TIGR03437 family)
MSTIFVSRPRLCIFFLATVPLLPLSLYADGAGNAAVSATNGLAPGGLATYYGADLSASVQTANTSPLPKSMNGVTLYVNGIAAPLLYVSPSQINFQVPYETAAGTATIMVTNPVLGNKAPVTARVSTVALGIFSGAPGYSAVLNQDYSLNSAATPAKPGTVISVYVNGIGSVTNPVPNGYPASLTTLSYAVFQSVGATIGGMPAQVIFVGLAPGFIGLGQIDLKVPNLVAGDFQLALTVGADTESGNVAVGQSVTLPPGSGAIPTVHIDTPLPSANVTGTVTVSGWAINTGSNGADPVTSVRVQMPGQIGGYATYGIARPDACAAYPKAPNCPNVGFTFQLPISPYSTSGPGTITVLANDTSTPLLTGSSSVTVTVQAPLSVSPNPVTIPLGGTTTFYADRSVYWSAPKLGKLIIGGNPSNPGAPNLPYTTALYQAPSAAIGATDAFVVTDAADATKQATVTVNLAAVANLSITETSATISRGQTGFLTILVSNAQNASPTSGTVTVDEGLPGGLTLVSMSGSGWVCIGPVCTRGDALLPGAGYPPITAQVSVSATAESYLVGQVSLSGGGSPQTSAVFTVGVQ